MENYRIVKENEIEDIRVFVNTELYEKEDFRFIDQFILSVLYQYTKEGKDSVFIKMSLFEKFGISNFKLNKSLDKLVEKGFIEVSIRKTSEGSTMKLFTLKRFHYEKEVED